MAIYGSLGEVNIGALSASISATASDIFVYDTRKDSDGGAWRKRTQHTSWYNETLNTATRGSRRDFPAVAVIVATTNTITIYDGDDPDMPMWMKFTDGFNTYLGMGIGGLTSITMLNGIMVHGGQYDVHVTNFISDKTNRYGNDGITVNHTQPISGRNNDTSGNYNGPTTPVIANRQVNDVAMTVLPNAPIDPSTGLPVPTIAVATNGGTSIIRDDGTVTNAGGTTTTKISINEKGIVYFASTANGGYYGYSLVGGSLDSFFNTVGYLRILSNVNSNTNNNLVVPNAFNLYSGQTIGLTIVNKDFLNTYNDYNGMVAYATTSYNTGWMHGNIKGAFLSDTSTASVTGTELITNGTFTSGATGWAAGPSGTISVTSGVLRVTNTATNGRAVSNTFATVVGQRYILTADGVTKTTTNYYMEVRGPEQSATWASGTGSLYFTAVGTTTYVELYAIGSGVTYSEYDNVSVRLAEADRSVNNTGLAVYGTLTKSAVATGADLVAYGNWDSSNYLLQPSAIAVGTSNFSLSFWIRPRTINAGTGSYFHLFSMGTSTTTGQSSTNGFVLKMTTSTSAISNGYIPYFYSGTGGGGGTDLGTYNTNNYFPLGVWSHCVAGRNGGVFYMYINGRLVQTGSANSTNFTDTYLSIGSPVNTHAEYGGDALVSLLRYSLSFPSPEQIRKIYEDEKALFQENSKAVLFGSSSAVTALAYDDTTKLLHVGTSSGRSDFQGLERINNTTTAVTTAISASNGLIAEQ